MGYITDEDIIEIYKYFSEMGLIDELDDLEDHSPELAEAISNLQSTYDELMGQ